MTSKVISRGIANLSNFDYLLVSWVLITNICHLIKIQRYKYKFYLNSDKDLKEVNALSPIYFRLFSPICSVLKYKLREHAWKHYHLYLSLNYFFSLNMQTSHLIPKTILDRKIKFAFFCITTHSISLIYESIETVGIFKKFSNWTQEAKVIKGKKK